METTTAQPGDNLPTTPRPEEWPETWVFQYPYWNEGLSYLGVPGRWAYFVSSAYPTEKDAIESALRHERRNGGPVRIVRIPGTAKGATNQ